VTAAGYVGLVTGACPLDLGIGRRVRPLGPQLVDVAAPARSSSTSSPSPILAGDRRRWPTSSGCWNAATTWSWPPISPPSGGGWAWSPRRWRRSGLPGQSGSTSGWSAGRSRTSWRLRAHRVGRWREHAAGLPRGDRGRPVAGGAALVRAGRAALGADGGGLASCGQGRSRTAGVQRPGPPAPKPRPTAPTHRLTAGTADPTRRNPGARWRSAVDLGQARSSKRCRSHPQAKEATWRST
jgi:hypothetical protein